MSNFNQQLADAYASELKEALNADELTQVLDGASEHDFYDANDSVLAAYVSVFNRQPAFLNDCDTPEAQDELEMINASTKEAINILDHEIANEKCLLIMTARPDLELMSLDEWILEHSEKLSAAERANACAALKSHPDHRNS